MSNETRRRFLPESIVLRTLLIQARHELANAKDLALGKTHWLDGEGVKHWTEGEGAQLLRKIDNLMDGFNDPGESA